MLKKIGMVIVGILAVLGVLFIVLLVWPDGDDDDGTVSQQTMASSANDQSGQDEADAGNEAPAAHEQIVEYEDDEPGEGFAHTAAGSDEVSEESDEAAESTQSNAGTESTGGNAAQVSIPASELSGNTIRFKTLTLDNTEVTQEIFSDYDLTIVHVWGTYCQPCISEMGDYAELYRELPDNVNLIAIVCDVYDGIDRNVSDANGILSDAGAEFMNLRTSDDVFDLIADLTYIPSSFFVDRDGHLVGGMLNGASFSDTVAQLDEYLN